MLQITIFDTKIEYFCREKVSLCGTPVSLPKIADLPIWAQEKITYGSGNITAILPENIIIDQYCRSSGNNTYEIMA